MSCISLWLRTPPGSTLPIFNNRLQVQWAEDMARTFMGTAHAAASQATLPIRSESPEQVELALGLDSSCVVCSCAAAT